MAARKNTRRITKKSARTRAVAKQNRRGGILEYFRLSESYASLLLGLVVVIVAAILLISFLRNRNVTPIDTRQDISATKTVTQTSQAKPIPGGTYVVQSGDDLWKIAENAYNDGYKWTDVAKANNITDPGMITVGQKLTLPKLDSQIAQDITPTVTQQAPTIVTQAPVQPTGDTPSTGTKISGMEYTVVKGDYLWEIAVRAYGDGYKWVDIARTNNLTNPDIIHPGNRLKLPR